MSNPFTKLKNKIVYSVQEMFNLSFDTDFNQNTTEIIGYDGTNLQRVKTYTDGALFGPDFLTEVAKGNITGHSVVHKFGSGAISTSLIPISSAGVYQTPTTAQALELVSSDAADAQNGVGARQVTIVGLNAAWQEVTQVVSTHATNGTTAVSIPISLTRMYRWYVSSSGTYATTAAGSHAGTLTIRAASAGATWDTIGISPFALGQSEIGVYTVPLGKTAYLIAKNIFVEGTKPADIFFFQRPNANDVATPYSGAMRLVEHEIGVDGAISINIQVPKGPFVGPCDIGFMGKVATTTADVAVEFELLLVDN